MKLPQMPVVGRKVKFVAVVAFAISSYFAINWLIGFTNGQLDAFATHRVESRQLPIAKVETKVFVTDGSEVVEAAKEAAKQGAAEGASQSISNALEGKH